MVRDGATLTLVIGAGETTLEGQNSYAGINVEPGGKIVIDKEDGYTDAECRLKVNGTTGTVGPVVDPNGGSSWLDGSALQVTAIAANGESVQIAFTAPVQAGLDFADWLTASVANRKLAVVVADSLTALQAADVAALLNGGSATGVAVVYVGTTAELVSYDATTKSVTVLAPKDTGTSGFYRVFVLD